MIIFAIPANHKRSIIVHWKKWIGLLLVLHLEWLALYWSFPPAIVKFAQSSSQREPEEMSQILLTNKKQGILDYLHADNIIKPT